MAAAPVPQIDLIGGDAPDSLGSEADADASDLDVIRHAHEEKDVIRDADEEHDEKKEHLLFYMSEIALNFYFQF